MEVQEARPREEESPWIKVVKKPRKTAVGKSSVNLEALGAGAEAGPVEIYISNTSNTSDEDAIMKVLETTAAVIDPSANFKVTKAQCLTKDTNPRTKCWKVTVPYKFRELMEKEELYPAGWRYRKFFAARNMRNKTAPAGARRQELQEGQVITLQEALKKIALLEANSASQVVVSPPAECSVTPPAGGSEGAGSAQ